MRYLSFIICVGLSIAPVAAENVASVRLLLQKYCVSCHGQEKQKGDVRLDRMGELDADAFQAIYEQLASEQMPPDSKSQPTQTERALLSKHMLEMAQADSVLTATGFRRLNKREYGNTVRDLLGLRNGVFDPGEYIYEDEIDEGFDTEAESLVISNELLLEYMGAAEKSLRQALFIAGTEKPPSRVIDVDPKKMQGTSRRYINNSAKHVIGRSGGKATLFDGETTRTMKYPGRYTITVTARAVDRDRYPVKFTPQAGPLVMGFGVAPDGLVSVSGKGKILQTFELKDDVDQTFTIDTWVDQGHYPYFSFVNGSSKPITQVRSNIRRRKLPSSSLKDPYMGPGIRISKFRIEGPRYEQWPPESLVKTYVSRDIPDLSKKNAREWLIGRFAMRAFRRPVSRAEVEPYFAFLNQQYAASRDWHESVIKTFSAMMSSPDFLYLREREDDLDAFALASRLSYFFWSTMPDPELFSLAKSGRLAEAAVLRQQVTRMLADPRSQEFCNSFANQWLALDTLGSMPPDQKGEYRNYYRARLEPAMLEETRRYFQHVLRTNLSVRDFIDSDYSFVNKPLAEHYGVKFPGGDDEVFSRVVFEPNVPRGGLMGHASILTLSANGVETSPVERGVWVLADLLGTPPPPPPKEVPALTPDLNGADTVRDMLERHRSDAACKECHRRMDPLGFALEAFDPIGGYRTKYSKTQEVSTEGNYMGEDFANVTELKKILARDIRPFARNLIVRIAEYAKGRKLVANDHAIVQSLVDQAAANDFKFNDIVLSIATGELITKR